MKISCPHCESKLDAPEELHGEIVECPECNNELSVTEENFVKPPKPPETKQAPQPAPAHTPLKKNNGALYGCGMCLLVALIINFFQTFFFFSGDHYI